MRVVQGGHRSGLAAGQAQLLLREVLVSIKGLTGSTGFPHGTPVGASCEPCGAATED